MGYIRKSDDFTWLVRDVAEQYPAEWSRADKEKAERTEEFIRIFAWIAYKVNTNIGLNGKRGGDEISKDAIAYKNDTVPAELGGCEVIDIIIGGGHKPAWQDVTLPHVAGKWIQPSDPGIGNNPVISPNPQQPSPDNQIDQLKRAIEEMQKVMIKVGDEISLKTLDWDNQKGKYVCSEKNNGGRLIANRDDAGTWEKYKVGK